MKIRLTESDLKNIVKKLVEQQEEVKLLYKNRVLFPMGSETDSKIKVLVDNMFDKVGGRFREGSFNISITAGESKVTNPDSMSEGKLAKVRARKTYKYIESRLSDLDVDINLKIDDLVVGDTPYNSPEDLKDKNKLRKYNSEQFIEISVVRVSISKPCKNKKIIISNKVNNNFIATDSSEYKFSEKHNELLIIQSGNLFKPVNSKGEVIDELRTTYSNYNLEPYGTTFSKLAVGIIRYHFPTIELFSGIENEEFKVPSNRNVLGFLTNNSDQGSGIKSILSSEKVPISSGGRVLYDYLKYFYGKGNADFDNLFKMIAILIKGGKGISDNVYKKYTDYFNEIKDEVYNLTPKLINEPYKIKIKNVEELNIKTPASNMNLTINYLC